MNIKVRQRNAEIRTLFDVVELEVEPDARDQRTQAERNADNALAAARLARVEQRLRTALTGVQQLREAGATRITLDAVQTALGAALEARVEP